jgi:pimeloyl-ACP methyl ester carboxylesterase
MSTSFTQLPTLEGSGSVSGAPHLPAGFTNTFTSRYVDTGEVRLHAVIGGDSPPLLVVHGWPETWYAWRLLMPALARAFQVIAVDQRGMGLSDKPASGDDAGTRAHDMGALMDALGHQRFAVVGHDTGMLFSYALAADYPNRIARIAVAETFIPGVASSPPLLVPAAVNDVVWHRAFNRVAKLNEPRVSGRKDIFFGFEFAHRTVKKLPDYVVKHYVDHFASSPEALRGSFEFYRALDTTTAQNLQRKTARQPLPVLAIGGAASSGENGVNAMKLAADDVQSLIIPSSGHFVAEEAPEEMLAGLTAFLTPTATGWPGPPPAAQSM